MQQRYVSVLIKFKAFKISFITCKLKKWECDCHIISVVICTQRHTSIYEALWHSSWKLWGTWGLVLKRLELHVTNVHQASHETGTDRLNRGRKQILNRFGKCQMWCQLDKALVVFKKLFASLFFIHIAYFFWLFCLPALSFTTSLYHWFLPSVLSLFLPTVVLFDSLPFLKEI